MQPQPKNDLVYLLGILEAIGKIEHYSKDFDDPYEFYIADDQLRFNASLMLIATIGDYARKVSIDMQAKYPEVPWKEMYGTRNRIAHDYMGVDFEITFRIIKTHLPELRVHIEGMTNNELRSGILSQEELEIAHHSSWYKYVDFSALV
ncbi:HepT-like ribonuclease domain-containing protein [Parapedobacter sp. 10938]|uniref:HepT-like ribonuclease domain-containing protein n=1 Tax=Parapedobacter flavus TaxID=3110225 RepID=UPI002DC016B9|nr:HepT-like ribonuclease domain-containing protein [Parapedobacter sp. 10938]MEC3881128.1 HepT-like ribonuclease domain-containing protein [Parapedobacter sp. 10938]